MLSFFSQHLELTLAVVAYLTCAIIARVPWMPVSLRSLANKWGPSIEAKLPTDWREQIEAAAFAQASLLLRTHPRLASIESKIRTLVDLMPASAPTPIDIAVHVPQEPTK